MRDFGMDDQAGEVVFGGSDDLVSGGAGGTVRLPQDVVAARLQRDAERLAGFKAAHTLPHSHGAVDFAPARGGLRLVQDFEITAGGMQRRSGAHWARADVFDAMDCAAAKTQSRAGPDAVFVAPFSAAQVAVGRLYLALTERHAAGGLRCASLEASRGGSGAGSFMDAFLAEGDRLAAMHRAIGAGVAMQVRRVRPSARGSGARCGLITDRALVDGVCLQGRALSAVLQGHGWSAKGGHRVMLRVALGAALDRMQGVRA